MLHKRSLVAKEFIKNYILKENINTEVENVCIVSHNAFLTEMMKFNGK